MKIHKTQQLSACLCLLGPTGAFRPMGNCQRHGLPTQVRPFMWNPDIMSTGSRPLEHITWPRLRSTRQKLEAYTSIYHVYQDNISWDASRGWDCVPSDWNRKCTSAGKHHGATIAFHQTETGNVHAQRWIARDTYALICAHTLGNKNNKMWIHMVRKSPWM